MAPADGLPSIDQRIVFLDGISRGLHIINGLHELGIDLFEGDGAS